MRMAVVFAMGVLVGTTAAPLRQRGLTVSDPGAPNPWASSILTQVNDPVYGRIELAENPPAGKRRAATDAWKP